MIALIYSFAPYTNRTATNSRLIIPGYVFMPPKRIAWPLTQREFDRPFVEACNDVTLKAGHRVYTISCANRVRMYMPYWPMNIRVLSGNPRVYSGADIPSVFISKKRMVISAREAMIISIRDWAPIIFGAFCPCLDKEPHVTTHDVNTASRHEKVYSAPIYVTEGNADVKMSIADTFRLFGMIILVTPLVATSIALTATNPSPEKYFITAVLGAIILAITALSFVSFFIPRH